MVLNFNIHSLNNASDEGLTFNFWNNSLNFYGGGDTPYYIKTLSKTLLPFNFTSAGFDLINYEIFGNSVQPTEVELYNSDLWQDGFINSSGSANPVISSSYPDAKYFKITLKQGQVVQFTVAPNDTPAGRVRYIDPTTNTVQGTIGLGTNKDYVTSTDNEDSGFRSATLTALKDVTLAFMDILGNINIYTNFSLITDISPASPVEIESVGDKTVNLLNFNAWKTVGSSAGIESCVFDDIERSVTLTRKLDSGEGFTNYGSTNFSAKIIVKPNTQYTFSWKANTQTDRGRAYLFENGNTVNFIGARINTGSCTLTTTTEAKFIIFRVGIDSPAETIKWEDLQIIEGETAIDYEPYGYKIPVKVSGKNLLNPVKIESYKQSDGSYLFNKSEANIWENTDGYDGQFVCTATIKQTASANGARLRYIYTDGSVTNIALTNSTNWVTISTASTLGKVVSNVGVFYANNTPAYVKDIQLEKGSVATPYQPYIEPVTTNIYLDEPLRKIGDYADVIDFKNQKVIRNIASVNSVTLADRDTTGKLIRTQYTTITGTQTPLCLSDKYPSKMLTQARLNDYAITNYGTIFIRDKDLNDTYSKGDTLDVNIIYVLNTPTEEAIQLPPIETSEGTNVFDVETKIKPSKVTITYYSKDKDGTVTADID